MQKYKKPDTSKLETYVNPFSVPLKILVNTIEDPHKFVVEGDAVMNYKAKLEVEPKCSLYIAPQKRIIVNALTPSTKELFIWLMYTIEPNKDFIWINKDRYMLELDITSINTYKKALFELERYGIIALTSVKDTYWINPDFFFRGNRVTKYPKNVVENVTTLYKMPTAKKPVEYQDPEFSRETDEFLDSQFSRG